MQAKINVVVSPGASRSSPFRAPWTEGHNLIRLGDEGAEGLAAGFPRWCSSMWTSAALDTVRQRLATTFQHTDTDPRRALVLTGRTMTNVVT